MPLTVEGLAPGNGGQRSCRIAAPGAQQRRHGEKGNGSGQPNNPALGVVGAIATPMAIVTGLLYCVLPALFLIFWSRPHVKTAFETSSPAAQNPPPGYPPPPPGYYGYGPYPYPYYPYYGPGYGPSVGFSFGFGGHGRGHWRH